MLLFVLCVCVSISQFLDRNMYLTTNAAYIDRSQQPSALQRGDRGTYVPPASYETIPDPPNGLTAGGAADRQYEVLEPTPGEPRRGPPISQVTADIVAQHYEMFESHPPGNPTQSVDYEVPVDEGVSNQQPARGGDEYSRLQY